MYSVHEKIPRGLKRHAGPWAVMRFSTEFSARTLASLRLRSIGAISDRTIVSDLLDGGS